MRASILFSVCLLVGLAFAGCMGGPAEKDAGGQSGAGGKIQPPLGGRVATLKNGSLADLSLLKGIPLPVGEERYIGARSFEPTIGVTASGTIFMVAFGGGAKIRASSDEGATWKQVNAQLPVVDPRTGNAVNNPPNSNDPFVYVDRVAGRVFTNDLQALVCSWMNFSDDEGKTWTTNPIGCGHPFGVHDHQSIYSGKSRTGGSQWKGRVVYYCVNRIADTSCASSMDGGATFGALTTVFVGVDQEAGRFCGGLSGHVKVDNAGRVFIGKHHCGIPRVAVSEDDGKTWTHKAVAAGLGVRDHDVEIAFDEQDNVYAFWIADNGRPMLAISRDHGKSYSPPMQVGADGVTAAALPAVAAAGPGKVAFAYIGTNRTGGYASTGASWDTAKWHGYIGLITNALDPEPLILTTRIDSAEDPLAVKQCVAGNDDRCNGMGDFIDITIDGKGRPWAAFVDVCHQACREENRNETSHGVVGTLREGPSLLAAGGPLPPLTPLVLPSSAPKPGDEE